MSSRISVTASRAVRALVRRMPGAPTPYEWKVAHSIEKQQFTFSVAQRQYVVEAGHDTPVYETIREIVDYDCYQLDAVPSPPPDACVVDVGANIGIASIALQARFGLPVYSFEPIPANVSRLERNVAVNDLDGITVVPRAIGATTGRVYADMSWEASVSPRASADLMPRNSNRSMAIDMVTLSDALADLPNRVHLMKLDCEGAEFEIVDQIDAGIKARIDHLTFEVHDQGPDQNLRTIETRLQELGYRTQRKPEMRGRGWMNHILASRV